MIFALMKGNKGQVSLLSLGVNIHFGIHEAEGHYSSEISIRINVFSQSTLK